MSSRSVKSIYDLAGETGVPAVTVRRVLNGREGIGEATRLRVLAAVREASARKRVRARRPIVAVVADGELASGESEFEAAQLSQLIATLTAHDFAVELLPGTAVNRLADAAIEGVLFLAPGTSTLKRLRNTNFPMVVINRIDAPAAASVSVDYRGQGEMALAHLFDQGHRRVAIVCETRKSWSARERTAGFMAAARERGMRSDDVAALYTDYQPMYGVLRHLLEERAPTALFFAGEDMLPEGAYILHNVLGRQIPGDVSVVGMESGRATQFHSPAITAIVEPTAKLARKAVELLVAQIDGDHAGEPVRITFPSFLIERESVMARH